MFKDFSVSVLLIVIATVANAIKMESQVCVFGLSLG